MIALFLPKPRGLQAWNEWFHRSHSFHTARCPTIGLHFD
jgi:hypothetical protein